MNQCVDCPNSIRNSERQSAFIFFLKKILLNDLETSNSQEQSKHVDWHKSHFLCLLTRVVLFFQEITSGFTRTLWFHRCEPVRTAPRGGKNRGLQSEFSSQGTDSKVCQHIETKRHFSAITVGVLRPFPTGPRGFGKNQPARCKAVRFVCRPGIPGS
jgi:hypothetical protein